MPRPSTTLALLVAVALPATVALWRPLTVVDGDTVDYGYWRWRLAGFDAPEIRNAQCPEERALGNMAALRLRGLVEARPARLAYLGHRDQYGRLLGLLRVLPEASLELSPEARNNEDEDVAAIAIREGWGHAYDGSGKRPGWCHDDAAAAR